MSHSIDCSIVLARSCSLRVCITLSDTQSEYASRRELVISERFTHPRCHISDCATKYVSPYPPGGLTSGHVGLIGKSRYIASIKRILSMMLSVRSNSQSDFTSFSMDIWTERLRLMDSSRRGISLRMRVLVFVLLESRPCIC
jgi:hypothetical protein